jgi:amino acid transporter
MGMATVEPETEATREEAASLEQFGYKQELHRGITVLGNVALAVSDITPTAAVLTTLAVILTTAGTASLWSVAIAFFIAINVALCMGELGSMYPLAGGLYSIVTRVFGKPIGFLALVDYVGQGIFIPATVIVGFGTYVNVLVPAIPSNVAAGVGMIAVTLVALLQIRWNAYLTGFFLVLELLVVGTLGIVGFIHWNQPLSNLTNWMVSDSHGHLSGVGISALIAAITIALYAVNGYDSAINFSEETKGGGRQVGRAVVTALLIAAFFEFVPFVGIYFGTPSLAKLTGSVTGITDSATAYLGSIGGTILVIGAVIAFFNATLAITLQFSRMTWASGRDRAWPNPLSGWLAKVNSRGAPWVATLVIGALSTIFAFQASLVVLVTFTAVLIVVLYATIAVASIVSRARDKQLGRPYMMPLWPVPPIIVVVGVVIALTQQQPRDLIISAALFVAAAIYYYAFLRPRKDRYWLPESPTTNS